MLAPYFEFVLENFVTCWEERANADMHAFVAMILKCSGDRNFSPTQPTLNCIA